VLRVGLTGGIASGKTRVRTRLAECGLATFDLDRVAHTVVEPGRPAHAEIARLFGPSVLAADGRIDRRVLGGIVFSDAAAREDLNAIVHPRVFEEEERLVAELPADRRDVVVTDATLLVESGYHVRYGRLVATHCRVDQQLERLMQRDGQSAADARARVAAQMPVDEKARYAHRVIDTSGSEEETDRAARALADELRALSAARGGPAPVELSRAVGCLVRGPQHGPRGLTALRLAQAIGEHGAPPFPALARALVPPARVPWYDAGRLELGGPGPETLMGPVVLWTRARHGADIDCVLLAAVSMARLTHAEPSALAAAASFAVALHVVADAGRVPSDLISRVHAEADRIERWTGAAPRPWGGALQGALDGLAQGVALADAPPETAAAAAGLLSAPAQRSRV
jgi:dephospho-CoA kinase